VGGVVGGGGGGGWGGWWCVVGGVVVGGGGGGWWGQRSSISCSEGENYCSYLTFRSVTKRKNSNHKNCPRSITSKLGERRKG